MGFCIRAIIVVVILASIACGCGLAIVGQADLGEDGGAGGGSLPDGGTPPPPPNQQTDAATTSDGSISLPPPPPCLADACALPLATSSTFGIVLFGKRTDECPVDFAPTDIIENPVAQPAACGCGTCVPTADCTGGAAGATKDDACTVVQGSVGGNGGCNAQAGTFAGNYISMIPPPAVLGPCSVPSIATRANVVADQKRLCAPKVDSCSAVLCAPTGSLRTCLVSKGNVACPSSASDKHIVGGDFTLACADCSCVTNKATCSGTATFYSGSGCSGTPRVIPPGQCTQVNGASFQSTRWVGMVASKTCSNVVAGEASLSVTDVHTVCCPP